MHRITSDVGVSDLADLILDSARQKPVCVVTSDASGQWLISGEDIESDLGEIVQVFEVPNGPLTYLLAERLPSGSVVFGGAARIYPRDFAKNQSSEFAPLFQFNSPRGASIKKDRIIDKLWMMAKDAGLLEQRADTQRATSAKIKGFVSPELAMVDLPNGELGTIRQDLHFPDVPLDWIFKIGDEVPGVLDSKFKMFTPQSLAQTKTDLLALFGDRSVTLGLVKSTTRTEAEIALMPAAVFAVAKDRISGNPMDVIDRYLDVGDVVRVRIYRDEQGRPALRLDDLEDDEEPTSALALVPNGRPWLEEGRYAPWREAEVVEQIAIPEDVRQEIEKVLDDAYEQSTEAERSTSLHPFPQPPGMQAGVAPKRSIDTTPTKELRNQLSLQVLTNKQAKTRVEELERSLGIAGQRLMQANEELLKLDHKLNAESLKNARYREELGALRKSERQESTIRSTTRSRRDRFASDQEWFDEEIRRAWIGRYTPQDRVGPFPLKPQQYEYDDRFFASIATTRMDESELRKLVRVVVDLVTGRLYADRKMREFHPLFEDGRPVMLDDGSPCMRLHLENGTPGAKRLHFYQLRDGRISLGWVGSHDEDLK